MSNVEKKFEVTSEFKINKHGIKVYRIRSLRDFFLPYRKVEKGELGGFVQNEGNLFHSGNCWIGEEASVWGSGFVCGDALVEGEALVLGKVSGRAWVKDSAYVDSTTIIFGEPIVGGEAVLHNCFVYGNAHVEGAAYLENVRVKDHANIAGYARMEFCDGGYHEIGGYANIWSDACLYSIFDVVQMATSTDGQFSITAYRTSNGSIKITCPCFLHAGVYVVWTVEELKERRKDRREYVAALADFIEAHMKEHEKEWWERHNSNK